MSLLKSFIVIPTFLIGVAASLIFSTWEIPKAEEVLIGEPVPALKIDVCDLGERPGKYGKYVGKRVVVEATIYSIQDHIVVYPLSYCHEDYDPFINTDLDLGHYWGRNQDLKFLLEDKKPMSEIDVRIEGTVRDSVRRRALLYGERDPSDMDLFDFTIDPSDIKIISPWRKFTPKAAA
jgi:hypothetical protein